MKNLLASLILLLFLFSNSILNAQSPQSFRYQAVVRNASGNVLQTQNVSLKISLLQSSSTGTVVYSEEHTATTNTFGLVNLEIGNGVNQTGSFTTVDWSNGPYYIKIELDATGGSIFTEMGTTQLLSVPYALYAASGTPGPQGPQGEQGLAGQNGQDGQSGADGIGITSSYVQNDSLYLVLSNAQVLNAGHVRGAQGIQGLQGVQGLQGDQGEQGLPGTNGTDGANGINGIDGISVSNTYVNNDSLYITFSDNTTINAGHVRGAQGVQGIQGEIGNTGPMGPIGPQGAAGTGLTNRGTWITGTEYNPSDYVFDQSTDNPLVNSMWICQTTSPFTSSTNPYLDATNWIEFQAPAGQDGLSIVWLGSFTEAPLSPNTNEAYYNSTEKKSYIWNGTSWEILSQDGADGIQGSQGIQGLQGIQGEQGLQGEQGVAGTNGTNGTNGANGVSVIWLGSLATAPASPVLNQGYYNTTDKKSYIYNGTGWQIITQDGLDGAQGIQGIQGLPGTNGLSLVWLGSLSSAPPTPSEDQAYYNTTNHISYIFDGEMWNIMAIDGVQGPAGQNGISVTWLGSFLTVPATPSENDAYYNITEKKSFIFDGNTWQVFSQDGADGAQGPQGIQGIQGGQGIQGSAGVDGISISWLGTFASVPTSASLNQAYYNSTDKTSFIYDGNTWQIMTQDGATGATGATGLQGPAGNNGATVLNGTTDPTDTDGADSDYYINTTTHFIFGPKIDGYWEAGTSLIGPQGIAGTNGTNGYSVLNGTGNPTSQGVNGDFYINTATNMIFGPKTGGVWGTGISLVGTQGIQGPQGPAGTGLTNRGNWVTGTTYDPSDYVFDRSSIDPFINSMWISQNAGSFVSNTQPYLDAVNWIEFQAPQGEQGTAGINGLDGKTVLNGTVDPTTEGLNGDFYINTATNMLFGPKTGGVWGTGISLVGPAGTYTQGTGITLSSGIISANFGTTLGTVAQGNHTHSQLHNQSHAITSASDHTANNWKLFYSNGSGQVSELSLGVSGQVLSSAGATSVPTWISPTTGSVTSVALSMPSIFTVTGSPVTSTGTLAATLASQAANTVFAAPNGTAGTPSFRILAAEDIPTHNNTWSTITFTPTTISGYGITDAVSTSRSLTISGTANQISLSAGAQTLAADRTWTVSLANNPILPGTASLTFTKGTTAQRPGTASNGMTRYNSETNKFEFYENGMWVNFVNNTSGITGTGLENYIPKFDATLSLDTSLMYQNGKKIGVGTTTPSGRFQIQQDAAAADIEPIFEIKDKLGHSVMIVYKDSVHFWVKDENGSKAENKGAFAVSGKNSTKSFTSNYFNLNSENLLSGKDAGFRLSSPVNYSGTSNTFLGYESGYNDTSGYKNTFLGYRSGYSNTSGYSNIFIGDSAGYTNSDGYKNVAIGNQSGKSNVSGDFNVFLGYNSGASNTANNNVFLGYESGKSNTSGTNNVFIGNSTGFSNINGNANVFLGLNAGYLSTTGDYNVFLGYWAGYSNTASRNSFIGYEAGKVNSTGGNNIFMGYQAGLDNTSGASNIFIGNRAGYNNVDGPNNVFLGYYAGYNNISGASNVFLGYYAGYTNIASYNVFLGYYAGRNNSSGTNNAFMGYQAGRSNSTGSSNVMIGDNAGYTNTTAANNVFLGYYAGYTNNASSNVFLGYEAGRLTTTGGNNAFMGNMAGRSNTTGASNVFIGDNAGYTNSTGVNNVFLGYYAGYTSNASNNVFLGYEAGRGVSATGTNNTFIGFRSGKGLTSGSYNVFLGDSTGLLNTTGYSNVFIGDNAGSANSTGYRNVFLGNNAGSSNNTGYRNIFIGENAGVLNTSGRSNVVVGDNSGIKISTGTYNVVIGPSAGSALTAATGNVAVGYLALNSATYQIYNTAVGYGAMKNSIGSANCAFGFDALYNNTTGSDNTAFGVYALQNQTTGSFNTAIGYGAFTTSSNYTNSTAIGSNTTMAGSNRVRLGASDVTSIGGYVGWTTVSDARFKKDITENVPGLDFILELKPVTYHLDVGKINEFNQIPDSMRRKDAEKLKEDILQTGFIAQDVESAAQKLGFDFSGIEKPQNEKDHYGLRYAEFTVPLVKGMQEQQKMIEDLKKLLEQQLKINEDLQKRIDALEQQNK